MIGITAPSAGVAPALEARLEYGLAFLRRLGYVPREGRCLRSDSIVSAAPQTRAAEFQEMLLDPQVKAIIAPWGGEIAIDLLPYLDFAALRTAAPTWLLGYSDGCSYMLPYTLLTGNATAHGSNLMEADLSLSVDGLVPWPRVLTLSAGASFTQHATARYEENHHAPWRSFDTNPTVDHFNLTEPTRWQILGHEYTPNHAVLARGRLIGGCLDVISPLAGSRYGDVPAFAARYAPEGLLLYLENCDATTPDMCRRLHGLRLAGWFERANALLIGRSTGPDAAGLTQREALLSAFDGLAIPIVYDMDIGHKPPQLMIVNGALGELSAGAQGNTLTQTMR